MAGGRSHQNLRVNGYHVAIVLICLLLIEQAAADDWALTKEDVLRQLKDDTNKMQSYEVVQLLSRANDKNEPSVVLGEFSFAQLLDLIWLDRADLCTNEEVERRQGVCEQLMPIMNLKNFCDGELASLQQYCRSNKANILDACLRMISPIEGEKLEAFFDDLDLSTVEEIDSDFGMHVAAYLRSWSESEQQLVRAGCMQLVNEIAKRDTFLDEEFVAVSREIELCDLIKQD